MIKIAPSILSANFADMRKDIERIEKGGADLIHCDVMDGIFVPNITFGFQMISDLKKFARLPLDVHLMITKPERYIERFAAAGADIITVHVESTEHVHRAIQLIKENGVKNGVVLNPSTPVCMIENLLGEVDMVLLMSVNPGYGGQSFIVQTLNKIRQLKKLRDEAGYGFDIEVDGGVNLDTAPEIIKAGANVLVAGSAVFNSENPEEMINLIRNQNLN